MRKTKPMIEKTRDKFPDLVEIIEEKQREAEKALKGDEGK